MKVGEADVVEFLVTFLFFLLIIVVMAVGVMRGREPISGTCGGLNQMGEGGGCELCGGDPAACRELDPMAEPLPQSKDCFCRRIEECFLGSFLNGESDFPSRNQSLSTRRAVPSSDSRSIERPSECLPRQIVDFLRRLGNASVSARA